MPTLAFSVQQTIRTERPNREEIVGKLSELTSPGEVRVIHPGEGNVVDGFVVLIDWEDPSESLDEAHLGTTVCNALHYLTPILSRGMARKKASTATSKDASEKTRVQRPKMPRSFRPQAAPDILVLWVCAELNPAIRVSVKRLLSYSMQLLEQMNKNNALPRRIGIWFLPAMRR